ncbi:MAG: DNA recombination protein RmuC, partial [Firmicutes bacterium]|nr:DNA recombination protein RmuC [Bacillota bacterium]
MTLLQKTQLDTLISSNEQKADKMRSSMEEKLEKLLQSSEKQLMQMRETLETKLKELQTDNTEKLEKIRATVGEKLQDTLERRLGESFKQVSERLEQVHKGLGEMQNLAQGVGDLKKALTNVKVRGTLGEIQLGNILQEILAPEQYAENVAVKPGSRERVEFAVKMPGRNEKEIWLPIDSKFPLEDYQRLLDAYDAADKEQAEMYAKQLENSIKRCAKDIN